MPSDVKDAIFSEPSGGRINAVIMFIGSLIFLGMYVWYGLRRTGSLNAMLIFAVGFALMGIVHSLPAAQRRIAGVLKIAAILVFIGLIILLIFAPSLVLGT